MTKTSNKEAVRYVEVDESREGQRLDNFLVGQLKGIPKSHIYRVLRRGEVRVNSGRATPDYRLHAGDRVRIPPLRQSERQATVDPNRYRWLRERLLYEDDDLLVLDKPAGLPVHGGSGVAVGVIEALRAVCEDARDLDLVHRLDRGTSGCLLVAKRRAALLVLHKMLRDGKIEKRYLALVRGRWRGGARHISAPLEHERTRSGERHVDVGPEGRAAESRFEPKGFYGPTTLVEVRLYTGRMHQARVHALHAGHPIAGDDKYGDREFNRELRPVGLRRLFLHAASLRFAHPVTGAKIEVKSTLPAELAAVLERLREPGV
ncbi:MAG: RluA family pseudouridine synthase [Sulfurifustis sp.]